MKRAFVFTACTFILAAFAGCAGTAANIPPLNGPAKSLRPGYEVVYYPKLQPNATLDSFQQKLNRILKNNGLILVSGDKPHYKYWHYLERINLYSDRIELPQYQDPSTGKIEKQHALRPSFLNILFNYNLLNCPIVVERNKEGADLPYVIALKGLMTFNFEEGGIAVTMADTLYFLQQEQKKKQAGLDKELARFQAIAAKYRALAIKPPVPEEQRKYIVQANAMAKQKRYKRAEEKYRKAIELDPTSYPGAYFNMALLAAQENDPVTAIFRMRQYLLLMPHAKDARSARDKIYVWEGMMGQ